MVLNLLLNDRVLSQLTEPLRIAVTGSLVHFQAKSSEYHSFHGPPAPLPSISDTNFHLQTEQLVGLLDASQPLGAWNGRDSYSASKFAQVLGLRKWAKQLEARLSSGKGPSTVEIIITHPGELEESQEGIRTRSLPATLSAAGLIPATGISRSSTFFTRLFKVVKHIPATSWLGIQSVAQGGTTLVASLTKPLEEFKSWRPFGPKKPRWTQPGGRVVGTYVTTGAALDSVDARTADEKLQARWWPTVADGL